MYSDGQRSGEWDCSFNFQSVKSNPSKARPWKKQKGRGGKKVIEFSGYVQISKKKK